MAATPPHLIVWIDQMSAFCFFHIANRSQERWSSAILFLLLLILIGGCELFE